MAHHLLTLLCILALGALALAGQAGQRDVHASLADLNAAIAAGGDDGAGSAWGSLAARVRKRQQEALDDKFSADPSAFLCPPRAIACPLTGDAFPPPRLDAWTAAGYECVDPMQELGNCGGCARIGNGTDCTRIRGARGATCVHGRCVVRACRAGFTFDFEGGCIRG